MLHPVTIMSEGIRLAGDLFVPEGLAAGEQRPALLLCHGWGGLKQHLSAAYAPRFCDEGYVVLTFDYRGWGESDGRLVPATEEPLPTGVEIVSLQARVVREVVDPIEQALDVRNCLDFLVGEDLVDPDRVGLWGSSYGGGMVVWTAAHDHRVKAMVAQVGSFGMDLTEELRTFLDFRGRQRARGEIDWPTGLDQDSIPNLNGAPDYAKFRNYDVRAAATQVAAATMVIDVDNEEYVDVDKHGKAVADIISRNAPVAYHRFSGSHYEIYEGALLEQATDLAVAWYAEHLRG